MATIGKWQWQNVSKSNFSRLKTTIETAFYGNNVELLTSRRGLQESSFFIRYSSHRPASL